MLRLASWIVVAGLVGGAACSAQDAYDAQLHPRNGALVRSRGPELGVPTSVDLKDATLGQVVDALTALEPSVANEGVQPINVLISDQLRSVPVGTIKLNNVYPRAALEGICKLTEGAFTISEVADGQVLVLKEFRKPVVVRAIKLQRPSPPNAAAMMSMFGGGGEGESEEAAKERSLLQQKQYESQIAEMLKSIDTAFAMYEETSGTSLDRPKLQIQDELKMVIVVGTEESVSIAAEIIEASLGGGSSNRRMGGGMGMSSMGGMGGNMLMEGSMGSGMMGGSGYGSMMPGSASPAADPNRPAPQKR